MKLSELRPCDRCRGPLRASGVGCWYVVRVTQAMVSPKAAREVFGLTMILGGSLAIAEAMAPRPEEAVLVLGDEDRQLQTELLLCFDCYTAHVPLAELVERRTAEKDAAAVGQADGSGE